MTKDKVEVSEEVIEVIIRHFLDTVDSIELISMVCRKEDWVMAIEDTADDAIVKGFMIGEDDWVEDHLLDAENFEIWDIEDIEEEHTNTKDGMS